MNTTVFRSFSVFSAIGISLVLLIGYGAGVYTNPVVNTLENQDLQRDLSATQEKLEQEQTEIEDKQELLDTFVQDYKKLSK